MPLTLKSMQILSFHQATQDFEITKETNGSSELAKKPHEYITAPHATGEVSLNTCIYMLQISSQLTLAMILLRYSPKLGGVIQPQFISPKILIKNG